MTLFFVIEILTYIALVAFYQKISNWWFIPQIFGLAISVFSTVYTFVKIPESPKFLYGQKRYDESRECLKQVNAFNTGEKFDSDLFGFIFDTENE